MHPEYTDSFLCQASKIWKHTTYRDVLIEWTSNGYICLNGRVFGDLKQAQDAIDAAHISLQNSIKS